jgi:hypothetical protein
MATQHSVMLCYRCKERPIPECNLRNEHMRCYRCHTEQYREKRKHSDRKYNQKPESKERHRLRERSYYPRRVRVAGRSITMPSVELKEQASELIRRSRDVFEPRQQG